MQSGTLHKRSKNICTTLGQRLVIDTKKRKNERQGQDPNAESKVDENLATRRPIFWVLSKGEAVSVTQGRTDVGVESGPKNILRVKLTFRIVM